MAEARELAAHRGGSTESPSRSTREGPRQGAAAPVGASQLSCRDSPTALVCTSSSRKRRWDLWEAGSPGKPGDSRGARKSPGRSQLLTQSCPTLCDPIDGSPPGSSAHGIFQARVLEWVAIAFSHGPHGLQHARPPCPTPTPGVHSDSHPSSQ